MKYVAHNHGHGRRRRRRSRQRQRISVFPGPRVRLERCRRGRRRPLRRVRHAEVDDRRRRSRTRRPCPEEQRRPRRATACRSSRTTARPAASRGTGSRSCWARTDPCLASPGRRASVVLDTRTLAPRRAIVLDGSWSFDARLTHRRDALLHRAPARRRQAALPRPHLRRPLRSPTRGDRRPPGRRGGDGRPARGEGVERPRPLGVHALRAPRRRAVRARPRHREARGVLYRPASAPRLRKRSGGWASSSAATASRYLVLRGRREVAAIDTSTWKVTS